MLRSPYRRFRPHTSSSTVPLLLEWQLIGISQWDAIDYLWNYPTIKRTGRLYVGIPHHPFEELGCSKHQGFRHVDNRRCTTINNIIFELTLWSRRFKKPNDKINAFVPNLACKCAYVLTLFATDRLSVIY